PAGTDPHAIVTAHAPVTTHPDRARVRPRRPAAAQPDPAAVPFPTTAEPDESWIGRDRDDFYLRRGRFARLVPPDGSAWRRHINRAVTIDHLTFHAAGKQRQAGGD